MPNRVGEHLSFTLIQKQPRRNEDRESLSIRDGKAAVGVGQIPRRQTMQHRRISGRPAIALTDGINHRRQRRRSLFTPLRRGK